MSRTVAQIVRFEFRERPWDLYAAAGYTALMSAALIAVNSGTSAAILLALFCPGYAIVAALFPSSKEIGWVERIALSMGLSIAVVPLLGLFLSFTPWGIKLAPIVITIGSFTMIVELVAYGRRMQLPAADRLAATIVIEFDGWKKRTLRSKVLTAGLVASALATAGAFSYALLTPLSSQRYTEFSILGPDGNASGYPTNLSSSQQGTVIIGIVNHESQSVSYTVRVDLLGVNILYNSSCGCNETQRINSTTMAWFNATIIDGGNWTNRFTFTIRLPAVWQVRFILFRDGDLSAEYRELDLLVRVH